MSVDRSYSSHTFGWGMGVARVVGAVIVGHVIDAHPAVAPSRFRGELLVGCALPPVVVVGGAAGGARHGASFDVEVFVVGVEWGFAPVYLLQTSPCGPVVRLP